MKHALLIGSLLIGSLLQAQTNSTPQRGSSVQPTPASFMEQRVAQAQATPMAPLYSNDVIINNTSGIDQRRVRLSVAFNGWLYAAYTTFDAATSSGGLTIVKSIDNGQTWTLIGSNGGVGIRVPVFDLVVTGTSTATLKLFVTTVFNITAGNQYEFFVDEYNAISGGLAATSYSMAHGTNRINDVAIASDYQLPAVGASPYSIGVAYSSFGSSSDSIIFLSSGDAGATWANRQTVQRTGYYSRNLSLSYGRSLSGSNGRYFIAWEQLSSSTARTGNIYMSRCQSTFDDVWITPVNLDSISSTMIGLCRNPQIATSFDVEDTDSSGISAVVLLQRDFTGNGSDYDLLGFYNKRAHFTNHWNRLDIVNNNENDLQPDISYDPTNNNFLVVYYDSTNGKIPYIVNGFNLTSPNTWTTVNAQVNDVTTNLKAAFPRVEINPVVTQVAHVWNAEGSNTNGVAMFDAEYVITGIESPAGTATIDNVYPNPAGSVATLNFTLTQAANVRISVLNTIGQVVLAENTERAAGNNQTSFDVQSLPAGIYVVRIEVGNQATTKRLVVAH